MAKLLLLLIPFIFCLSCRQEAKSKSTLNPVRTETIDEFIYDPNDVNVPDDTINIGKFKFLETTIEFDTINEGDVIERSYTFTNVGQKSILIDDVRSSCGCTIPTWPKSEIEPGESESIQVRFNSEGRVGFQDKPIILRANSFPSRLELRLRGFVIDKE